MCEHRVNKMNDRSHAGGVFFAAYTGLSMNPTLREPAIMEIVPYDRTPVRVGDVVLFLLPGRDNTVVHRVVRVTRVGITTRGDNNAYEDSVRLHPQDIYGRVVAAWCGRKRRRIVGKALGRMISRWLRWRRTLDLGVSLLLHPLYRALSRWGGIARLLPASRRPRVVVFRVQGQAQCWLLLGRQVIGRYDDRQRRWQIQRPFRLLVEERILSRLPETEQLPTCD